MKILIIMGGFFPGKKYGGPPVSIDNFCTLMSDYDCYIVTLNHDLFESKPYQSITDDWNDRGNCRVLYLSNEKYNKTTFDKIINEINPDILYLQGLFQGCIFPCLQLARKHKLKVLLAPRGELCAGALNMKKYKKIPYIKLIKIMGLTKNTYFQSTSAEETDAIKYFMGATEEKIHRLDNIPSIPKKEYCRRDKIEGLGRFVFLSRIHPKKNLLSAIKYFHGVEGNAFFDIYGSIEDEVYWEKCQEEIKKMPSNVKIEYKGIVSHEQVHEVFSQYDAFLFPTLSENYGHVIAESLSVGTPVITSDQTPWTDLEKNNLGYNCKLNDDSAFVNAITSILIASNSRCDDIQRYVGWKLDFENLRIKYTQAFKSL